MAASLNSSIADAPKKVAAMGSDVNLTSEKTRKMPASINAMPVSLNQLSSSMTNGSEAVIKAPRDKKTTN